MIRNSPLCFVADRGDCEINRSIDEADACAAASTRAFPTQADQSFCWDRAGLIRVASCHNSKILGDVELRTTPFL
jgi:hypothetical protein